jgi:hypothetical protein
MKEDMDGLGKGALVFGLAPPRVGAAIAATPACRTGADRGLVAGPGSALARSHQ